MTHFIYTTFFKTFSIVLLSVISCFLNCYLNEVFGYKQKIMKQENDLLANKLKLRSRKIRTEPHGYKNFKILKLNVTNNDKISGLQLNLIKNTENKMPLFNVENEQKWDYKFHGANWDIGMCKKGHRQSPVDLNLENLGNTSNKNLSKLFFTTFTNNQFGEIPSNFRPWKKGDFFFSYTNFFRNIDVYKTEKILQIRPPKQSFVPFGVLFATDTAEMFLAHQILFHSPSEHTFQGSGNRRQIEVQIWHYSNDILSLQNSLDTNVKLSYFTLFTQGSLGDQSIVDSLMQQKNKLDDVKNPFGHWKVVSLTFMSEELDQTTEKELQKLPSEKFLKTILKSQSTISSDQYGKVLTLSLEDPINLPSLMLMLEITNNEFFAYDGSSTMPGCNENVHWYVARQPLPVSTETMLQFYKTLNPVPIKSPNENDGNFRELQNIEDNNKNKEEVSLVQGFPLQVLIASTIGMENPVSNLTEINSSSKSFNYSWVVILSFVFNCFGFLAFL